MTRENVLFSIVVPLYNKEKTITRTIQSVLDQSYSNFEIIIVNDGSTDDSLKIAHTFTDQRIKIIDKPNRGVSSARNCGIDHADGDMIAFLDADDYWDEKYLQLFSLAIKEYPVAKLFFCDFIYNGREVNYNNAGKSYIVKNFYKSIKKKKLSITSSSVVIDRNVFSKVGLFNEMITIGEDIDMWYRIIWIYPYVHVPFKLSHVSVGDSQWMKISGIIPSYWINTYDQWKSDGLITSRKEAEFRNLYLKEIYKKIAADIRNRKYKEGVLLICQEKYGLLNFMLNEPRSLYYVWKSLLQSFSSRNNQQLTCFL